MTKSRDWRSDEQWARDVAQARTLREQAGEEGLNFEAYLPPRIAEWVLDQVARGIFTSPSEAVFVYMQEAMELAPHADLRTELLRRGLEASLNDPRPGITAEAFSKKLKEKLKAPRPEPACWVKQDYEAE